MSILDNFPQTDPVYFSEAYRVALDGYVATLLNRGEYREITISPNLAVVYVGDLDGLLLNKNVSRKHHLAVAIMNRYPSSSSYRGTDLTLKIPNTDALDRLANVINTEGVY